MKMKFWVKGGVVWTPNPYQSAPGHFFLFKEKIALEIRYHKF